MHRSHINHSPSRFGIGFRLSLEALLLVVLALVSLPVAASGAIRVEDGNHVVAPALSRQVTDIEAGTTDVGGFADAVGKNADGRLELFSLSGGSVVHNWQLSPNGSAGWSGPSGLAPGSGFTSLAVGSNGDGRLELFAIGPGGALYHDWQISANGVAGWSGLLPFAPGAGFTSVSVGTNADGRLELFLTDASGAVFHDWQLTPNGSNGWSGILPFATAAGYTSLGVGANQDGRLEVFATGVNGVISHDWQITPNASAGWSGFTPLDPTSGFSSVAVSTNADGRLQVFANGPYGSTTAIFSDWQLTANGTQGWSFFDSSQPMGGGFTSIAAGSNADGRLEIFADQYHAWQLFPNGTTEWSPLFTLVGGEEWTPQ